MTSTDIREALRSIADATDVPAPDRTAFQRRVRRERQGRLRSRLGLLAVTGAAAAVATVTAGPWLAGDPRDAAPEAARGPEEARLAAPVYFTVDRQVSVVDRRGVVHETGLAVEELLGSTEENLYAIGGDSGVVRYDLRDAGEDADDTWTFERVTSGVSGPVQSARVSPDGRWLAWIDLDNRLHRTNLDNGSAEEPASLPPSAYLADLASGTGDALIASDNGLRLHTGDGIVLVPAESEGGWAATVGGGRVAASAGVESATEIFDVSTGGARTVDTLPGDGVLSPDGAWVVSAVISDVVPDRALLWSPGERPVRLEVPGTPEVVGWADDDTALVVARLWDEGKTAVYGCEAVTAPASPPCTLLHAVPTDQASVDLPH